MKKILHIVQLLVLTSTLVFGKSGGDNPPKDVPKKPVSFTINQNGWQPTSAVSPQLQSSLDVALNHHLQIQEAANVQIVDKMDNIPFFVSEQADDDKSTARKMMSFLDANQDRVKEDIDFEDLTTLPIGLKKKLGDKSVVTIGILKVDFKQTHAEVTVFIRLTTPINSENSTDKDRDLFFGVENLKFTKQSGFGAADFKAVLLGDYLLPMKNWTVRLKGGLDKSIAPSENDTQRCYVKFECGGFKELNVAADIVVPRSVLLPYDISTQKVNSNESVRVTVSNPQ
jgi:hypothetical protein